ncbi:MAG: hypothetical protein FJ386_08405 [Verrucomicrobia bacterium]|nr:hypothetical protein [Verrucomicrobiota bacterium]
MPDDYQIGSDVEWLKHSNEELARLLKKRDRHIALLRITLLLALGALGWAVWKFSRKAPVNELWNF